MENVSFVNVKKKSIQLLLDYCLENRIEFTVSPKNSEEFKVSFALKDFNTAISLGMCLKELKIEFGNETTNIAAIKTKKQANGSTKELHHEKVVTEPFDQSSNNLSFDLDAMN